MKTKAEQTNDFVDDLVEYMMKTYEKDASKAVAAALNRCDFDQERIVWAAVYKLVNEHSTVRKVA